MLKEKRQFEVIESRQMDHLGVFHEVARALTQTLELEEILLIIMRKMAQFFGPERWSMLMVDEEAQDLYYAIAVGEDSQSLKGLRVPLGEGVAGWVASTGNPLVVPDVSLDTRWNAFSRAHPELRIRSIACIPIRSGEKTLGVIQLLNTKLDLESEYSISFLRILCDYAAIAIQNARSVKLIHELTITDDCTALYNARHLNFVLDTEIYRSNRYGYEFSVIFIDLDYFKQVNDVHGHLVGSKLLWMIGDLIKGNLRMIDYAFRYGGDEFVVLLPQTSKENALLVVRRVRELLNSRVFFSEERMDIKVTASFGIASFPVDGRTRKELLLKADEAMYLVKNTTRDDIALAGQGIRG